MERKSILSVCGAISAIAPTSSTPVAQPQQLQTLATLGAGLDPGFALRPRLRTESYRGRLWFLRSSSNQALIVASRHSPSKKVASRCDNQRVVGEHCAMFCILELMRIQY